MRSQVGFAIGPITSANDQVPFTIENGGEFGITYIASDWNSTTVTLEKLGPDGATWITAITAWSANGRVQVKLEAGQYRLTVDTGVTDVYVGFDGIPGE